MERVVLVQSMEFALTGMDKLLFGLVTEKLCLLQKISSNVSRFSCQARMIALKRA